MGRLIPAGTGMEYYRAVKIAGEDVVEEEPIAEEVTPRRRPRRLRRRSPQHLRRRLERGAARRRNARGVSKGTLELTAGPNGPAVFFLVN